MTTFKHLVYGLCFLPFVLRAKQSGECITSYVNPFIGNGPMDGNSLSCNNYPEVTVHFGMVQLSPDTKNIPDRNATYGYDYNEHTIAGLSHTHLSGTGVAEFFSLAGYPENESCYQMSSWYVMSAMGIYPVNLANEIYDLRFPVLKSTDITLENGKIFRMRSFAENNKDVYIN